MKSRNIFKSFPIFSLLLSFILIFGACDRNDTYGTKSGEEGEEPEAYGLQEDDLPGGEEDPASEDNQINTAEGETQKMASDAEGSADYPEEKIQEDTNLKDGEPLELSGSMNIQKKILIATLNGQRNDLEAYMRNLKQAPGSTEDSSILQGNVEKLKAYLDKLDLEMAKVRAVGEENFEEVAESAQGAIEGAGALIVSREMRITEGH